MSNKFGSMFDDDDDLGSNPQAPSDDGAQETRPAQVGLFNDEAAALIEEKAKQAAEQGKRAAKAGLAATARVAKAAVAKGQELKTQAGEGKGRRLSPMVLVLVVLIVLMGGVIGWLVLSKDTGSAETSQPVAPVVMPPSAGIAPATETPSPTPVQAPSVEHEPQPVEPAAPLPTMPVMGAGGGRYVPPGMQAPDEEVQEPAQQEAPAAPAPVSQPVVERVPEAQARPAPVAAPSKPRTTRQQHAKPSSVQPPKPAPAPIGEKEQQQIDQIRALFGNEP